MPAECGSYYELKCYRALASAGTIKPHAAPAAKDRLTVFDKTAPAQVYTACRSLFVKRLQAKVHNTTGGGKI